MSLRKKLRYQAEAQLDKMLNALWVAAEEQIGEIPGIRAPELLKAASGGRTDTIKHELVTKITNYKELELERFFNRQQDLELEEKAGKGKSK